MCCSDCSPIDPAYTNISGSVIHFMGTFTDGVFRLDPEQDNAPPNQLPSIEYKGKKHAADKELANQCVFFRRTADAELSVALDYYHDHNIKIIIMAGDPAINPKTGEPVPVSAGDPPGTVYQAATTRVPLPNGQMQGDQTIYVVYDKTRILNSAKAEGVEYGEEFVATIVHELGHMAVPNPSDAHTAAQTKTLAYYQTHLHGIWDRTVYAAVTADVHPRYKVAVGGGVKPPTNDIPPCVQTVINQYPNYFHSLDSGRSATYQYPTYSVSYDL